MTQTQLNWMQDNGYDPEQYDMDLNGNVLKRQAAVAEEDQREVMSMPRAFGTSFLGNLLPSAAALGGAKLGMMAGAPFGPVGVGIGAIGGGLGAGYLTGKGQEAVLENYAPEAIAEMQRAQTDQPIASYAGGFAPNALTFRPSLQGMSGLLRPTVRGEETLRAALSNPNFIAPASNIAANVAGSTAGQLVDMSQGGEFSAPRFLADTALGTLFNKPTGLGKRLGFQDTPENIQEAPGDLAKARDRADLMANVPKDFVTPRAERGAQDIVKPGVNIGLEAPDQYFTAEGKPLTEKAYDADYSKWWKSKTEPTTELLKAKAEEVKAKIPRDKLKELSNDPEVGEVLRDPSKMEAFVAKQADQTLEDVFQMMESRKAEEISRTEKARVEAEQNAIEIKKLQDLEASQALSDEAAARLQVLKSRRAELLYDNKDQGPLQLKNIREQSDLAIAQAQKEVADARAIAEDIWTRLQRPEGKQSNKITQEDINLATELANRRGLKVQLDRAFAGSQEVRGMYLIDKNTGDRIIRINPLMATADTAIHEIGHDIFKGVTNKGMRRSLMDTALDSPAYKAELASRMKEGMTEQGARDIALEEGLIQAFGEKMPDINRGELRAWFSAFKASMKQLVTGKMSPEDALAWMHYATTENVPWKGVAMAKTGDVGERLQRGEDNLSGQANTVRLIKTIVNQQGDLGKIEMRELVQNALDAVYKKPSKSGGAYEPREIASEVSNRSTALVSDTGTGMSPNFLSKGYLQLSVSTKGLTEGGGFGLAKAALFGRSEEFEVRTVWTDSETGRRFYSRVEGTPKGFYNTQTSEKPTIDLASITTQPKSFQLADGLTMHVAEVVSSNQETPNSQYLYDGPDGTAVAIKYPQGTQLDETASYKSLSFNSEKINRNYFTSYTNEYAKNPFHEKPEGSLFAKTKQFANMDESLYIHEKPDSSENAKAVLEEVDLSNAKVKTYLEPREYDSYHVPYEIYSNGVFQFRDSVSTDTSSKYPTILFDVKSKVLGEDPNYPFTISRNSVQGEVKNYVESTAKGFAEKQAQKQKEVFEKALVEAPKIITTKGDSVSILDVSKLIPSDVIRLGMTNDPVFGDIIEFSSLIHSIVRDNLSEAFPNAGYQGGDFAGVLTGTANAYGVRFGKSIVGSSGQIYYDPFLIMDRAIEQSGGLNNPQEVIAKYMGLHAGVAVHELSHQIVHSEGQDLSRELTFKMGSGLLDSPMMQELFNQFRVKADDVINTIQKYDQYIKDARTSETGDEFLSGLQTESTGRQSFSAKPDDASGSSEVRYQRGQGEIKDTSDPLNPNIRYQRGPVGKAADAVKGRIDKTLGEIDQITRRGGIYETVGRAMNRAYNTADSMLGKARSLGGTITKLNYGDATKLTSHLYNEYRNQQLLTPAPEIAAAYKEWRTQAKAFWVDETNKAGFQIMTGKGPRDRIESEYWMPAHKLSDEAREILANKIGTPEYQKLKDDYLRDATDDYLSQGKVMAKAQEKALVDFEEQRALANKTFDPSAPATFAGSRKPMGRPLPESWIEKDFRKLYESYNARSAKDYAAQQHFEKSPEVMAALGSKKFFNGQDIPANILQNTDVIAPDPSVQSVMREFSGQPLQMPGKAIRSIGSAASALALQTISRIGDVGGTVTKPLAYIGLGDYGAYMGGMAEKLSNWSKLKARSIESGLNNPNANQDFHQVIGMGQDAGKYMQKVLDSIGFITGSSKLESVARTLAQAQGEMIVSINKRKAATGDKDAVRFLDTLNNDWRTQSDMDLAAQFGKMMQGTYDMRQLPAWFLEGGAAPYLTWSKWSMGQMNNFRKFAVEPAMQGNLKPLIAQVLVGMAGGGAIEQVQEWLSGKESKAVKWSELESWARQNEGKIGTDGGELLMQKFMIMAQKTGTFGFAGDLAMMPINALVGDTQSSVGVFPAAELFADGMKNVAGALTAIDKGEDVGLVLQRFGKNVIVGKTQMARVASTWIDEVFNEGSDNLRSADRRKARLFEELSGTGRSNGMFPVSYENLAEQKFERGSVTEDTGEEAFELVSRAREQATSPEDYASRIRKLKTSQNAIMPSLERQPMKAARYLGFVEGAEPGKGSETLKRYYTRQNEDKYRKSLIEGMSGIR